MRGFTLVELLLAITLAFIVGAFMFPIGSSFFRIQTLDETATGLVSALRSAESRSTFGLNESAHGVRILSDSYVLFEGDSYNTRTTSADEVFPYPDTIQNGGIDEVVFSEITGLPNITGTTTLTLEGSEATIVIAPSGKIEY